MRTGNSAKNIVLLSKQYLVKIPELVQYVIYALAVTFDLRCESGT